MGTTYSFNSERERNLVYDQRILINPHGCHPEKKFDHCRSPTPKEETYGCEMRRKGCCCCCSEEVQSRALKGLRTEHGRSVSGPICLHL